MKRTSTSIFFLLSLFCVSVTNATETISTETLFSNQQHIFPELSVSQKISTIIINNLEHKNDKTFNSLFEQIAQTKNQIFSTKQVLSYSKQIITIITNNNNVNFNNACSLNLANDLAEWCLNAPSAERFIAMHIQQDNYPALQFLYTTLWSVLAEKGWCDWHDTCLKQLKQEYDTGKTIVYIAGGCDIKPLLDYGIYNITILDPLLPTQQRYYPKDYLFFIKSNGTNDHIIFNTTISLKRLSHQETKTYTHTQLPSGQQLRITHTKTEWSILNTQGKQLGIITFDRRPATQADFEITDKKILLMSWNELQSIIDHSWDINPQKFDLNLSLHIKQLRSPITKTSIDNLTMATKLNLSTFRFIGLGSDAT